MGKDKGRPGKSDLIEIRRARVLDLHSKGFTERAISEELKVGKSTVHDDIAAMRKEATERIAEFIESLPYEWTKAVTSFDRLLKAANDILEDTGLDFDQRISVIKSVSDLTEKRLALFSSPEIMKKSIAHIQKLKAHIEQLKKDQGSQWKFAYEIQQEAGQADKVVRKAVRKKAIVDEGPIV